MQFLIGSGCGYSILIGLGCKCGILIHRVLSKRWPSGSGWPISCLRSTKISSNGQTFQAVTPGVAPAFSPRVWECSAVTRFMSREGARVVGRDGNINTIIKSE